MKEKQQTILIIFGILLIISVISNLYLYTQEECPGCPQPEEKAQVFTSFVEWGAELGKQNGYILTYWVNNFGEIEAKDVVIECIITDQNDNVIKRINKNFGNLASNSMEYDEMYENIFEDTTDFNAYCLTKSCSNCDILENKITDLQKYLYN